VRHQVSVHASAGKDTYRFFKLARRIACMLHGLPRTFKKDALLRINYPGFASRQAEELRIEHIGIIKWRAFGNEIRVILQCLRHTRLLKCFIVKCPQGFFPGKDITPERVDVRRIGESSRHANNCNGMGRQSSGIFLTGHAESAPLVFWPV